ncbi:hypothetical protein [Singulisphaera sp. GP187]|uniref:hypothetical protein n=1 Tax=Singulisphaera sp. GP187 TaxID=1882752 RepID=UPI000941056A|nr:hypothetical protein [Singulisphaera sp. GP187]
MLLREYLVTRVGCKNKAESACCRSFLKTLTTMQADGNEMGIELAILPGSRPNTIEIYFHILGVGKVRWLPTLSMQNNERLTQIRRETGLCRVAVDSQPKARTQNDDSEPKRRCMPPKAETKLIQGQRI